MAMPGFSADVCLGRRSGYRTVSTTSAGRASLVTPAMQVCTQAGCYEEGSAAGYAAWGAFIGGSIGVGAGVAGSGIGAAVGAVAGLIACAFDSTCSF
jgi:hypothetical protein